MFLTLDLNFEVAVPTPTTPEQLKLLDFQLEGGIVTLPVPSNPQVFLIFSIKQLASIPLLYWWSLQQNLQAIPISWWNPKPISKYDAYYEHQHISSISNLDLGTKLDSMKTQFSSSLPLFSSQSWFGPHYSNLQSIHVHFISAFGHSTYFRLFVFEHFKNNIHQD